ncbi:hypothetical protein DFJ74DRAFT_120215 [Hyaloraphidium curvatum]|nr:hypothetical protein DFJ74DRAFT_120215 [Hyaloraphidium curvatum]
MEKLAPPRKQLEPTPPPEDAPRMRRRDDDGLDWFFGGIRPAHALLLAALVWLLRTSTPIVVEVRFPEHLLAAPKAPEPAAPAAPPHIKYTYKDFVSLMGVEPIYNTTVDPILADIIAAHDIRNDQSYKDDIEGNEGKEKMYGPFLEQGFEGDERLYIAWTGPERGYGLFASVGIPVGTPIGVYAGVVTNQSVGSRYSWHYNSDQQIKDENGNPIGLSLDAWHKGNYLRYSNHDEVPNTSVEMVPWRNLWHVVYVTSRALKPDEEVTVSYGDGYWSGRQHELKTGYTENPGGVAAAHEEEVVTVVETIVEEPTAAPAAAAPEPK